MGLELEAKQHIEKVKGTIMYLDSKIDDPSIPENKRNYMRKDMEAYIFLLEYALEALNARGIKV